MFSSSNMKALHWYYLCVLTSVCIQPTVSLRPPTEHKLFLHVYIGILIVAVSLTTLMINYLSSSIRKESYHPCPSVGLVLGQHILLSRGDLPIIRYLPQQSPYSPHSALWQVLKSIELHLCPSIRVFDFDLSSFCLSL